MQRKASKLAGSMVVGLTQLQLRKAAGRLGTLKLEGVLCLVTGGGRDAPGDGRRAHEQVDEDIGVQEIPGPDIPSSWCPITGVTRISHGGLNENSTCLPPKPYSIHPRYPRQSRYLRSIARRFSAGPIISWRAPSSSPPSSPCQVTVGSSRGHLRGETLPRRKHRCEVGHGTEDRRGDGLEFRSGSGSSHARFEERVWSAGGSDHTDGVDSAKFLKRVSSAI